MKFFLLPRHTGGREMPESEKGKNLEAWGKWIQELKASAALPVYGGKSVTSGSVED